MVVILHIITTNVSVRLMNNNDVEVSPDCLKLVDGEGVQRRTPWCYPPPLELSPSVCNDLLL